MLHDRGIMVNASFVFGLDSDGPAVFRDTLDWIVRNRIETVTSHILTPYPGTALYERMRAEGRLTDDDLSHYDTAHVVFRPKGMTAQRSTAGGISSAGRPKRSRNSCRTTSSISSTANTDA